MNVDVNTKKQSLSPGNEEKFRHFFNLAQHSSLRDRPDHITAWCSAFVNACMNEAGIPGTNDPSARCWETWGIPASHPRFGDVVVFGREDHGDRKTYGHVGLFPSPSSKCRVRWQPESQGYGEEIPRWRPSHVADRLQTLPIVRITQTRCRLTGKFHSPAVGVAQFGQAGRIARPRPPQRCVQTVSFRFHVY